MTIIKAIDEELAAIAETHPALPGDPVVAIPVSAVLLDRKRGVVYVTLQAIKAALTSAERPQGDSQ